MTETMLQHKVPDHASIELGGSSLDDAWLDSIHLGRTGLVEVDRKATLPSGKKFSDSNRLVLGLHSLGMTPEEIGASLDRSRDSIRHEKVDIFDRLQVAGENAGCLAVSQAVEHGVYKVRSTVGLEQNLSVQNLRLVDGIARGLTNQQIADELGLTVDGVKSNVVRLATTLGLPKRRPALAFFGYATGIVRPPDDIPTENTLPFVDTNPNGNVLRRNAYFPPNTWFELEGGQSLATGNVTAIHYRGSVIQTRATTISAKWLMALAMNSIGISAAQMAQTLQGDIRAIEKRLARTYKTLGASNLVRTKSGVAAIGKAFSEEHAIFSVLQETTACRPAYPMTLARMHLLTQGEDVKGSRIDRNRLRRDISNQVDKECRRQNVHGRDELALWLFATGQLPLSEEKKAELGIVDTHAA